MKTMDLINALQYIDDDLIFDAADGGAQSRKSAGAASAKQPRRDKPPRGGAKAKVILIGALACVCVAAMVCAILYFTGVFDTKQIPIYQGMEISSAAAESSQSGKNAASYSYSGDYVGKSDDVDKDKPFGGDSPTIEQETQSTLLVAGAGESIYYADAGDDIYITIKFSNPDSYEILSFVINGEKYTSYMFETGSDLENIIIKVNVGSVGGIIDYTISEIKYVDGTEIKDVVIDGDTVVKCGVRTSDITYASIQDEEVTFTSISFTVKIVDLYSLVEYSGGYLKAVLYDGESLAQTVDLQVGTNEVVFDNLLPDTLYQYAVVGYYDSLNGDGVALNYLYTNALYTTAVVLFDNIEVGQERIAFDYNWTEGYESQITSLTLTGGGATQNLSAAATSATGLLSDTDYTLTATYSLAGGGEDSISIEFTTLAKTAPELSVEFVDSTASSLTFSVDYTDTDGVGSITAIELYNGATLVKSESNLNSGEYTFSGLIAYTEYTIKVVYSYNLNDGTETQIIEESLIEYTDPVIEINLISVLNTSAVSEGESIVIQAEITNPSGATFKSVVVNGETYLASGVSTTSKLRIEIANSGQFAGGMTELTISQIICTIGGKDYTLNITQNNIASAFIYGELSVEDFTIARLNDSGEYEATIYGFEDDNLYYVISLNNATHYEISSVTISNGDNTGNNVYGSDYITISEDYQTVYVAVDIVGYGWYKSTLSNINYSIDNTAKTKTTEISAYFIQLTSNDIVEIKTAEDLLDIDDFKYYKLMNNIDLSGYEWINMNNNMYGVFDGNGYTISGFGAVTTCYSKDLYLGLFSGIKGVVFDLNINDVFYMITYENTTDSYFNVYIGGLSATGGTGGYLILSNVTVEITAQVTINGNVDIVYCGGLIGTKDDILSTENVKVEAVFSFTVNSGATSGALIYVGGLYGYGTFFDESYVKNIEVDMAINVAFNGTFSRAIFVVAGIMGHAGHGGYLSLYNVSTNTTVVINSGENNLSIASAKYENDGYAYIDKTCSATMEIKKL